MASSQAPSSSSLKADSTEGSDLVKDPAFGIKSTGHLQIPTLSVSGTPASWMSRSKLVEDKMAFQNDGDSSCDEAASSLGDSSYDFLDDRSAFTDDEERDLMSESASSDNHGPSTISNNSAHASQDSRLDDSPVTLTTPTAYGNNSVHVHSIQHMEEDDFLAEDPDEPILFEEPSVVNLHTSRLTEVCHTLRIMETPYPVEGALQKASQALPEGKVEITVRQTMASQSLQLNGKPYKVLIVGDDPATDLVVKKIAATLAASKKQSDADPVDVSPSKFSIVPISGFGDSRHPEVVLIDSSRLELSVEYCTAATYDFTEESKDILSLRMANGGRIYSCWLPPVASYVYSEGWEPPDLAILFTSEEEDAVASKTRAVAQSFMHRHGVSSIIIQKKAMWTKRSTLDYLTPHLCLESQQSTDQNAVSKIRYPIDLLTFLNIDEGQLNRNLACLAQSKRRESKVRSSDEKNTSQGMTFHQTLKPFCGEYTPKLLRFFDSFSPHLVACILLGIMLGCLIGLETFKATPTDTSILPSTNFSNIGETTQLSLSSTLTPVVSSVASTTSQKPATKTLSSNTDIASFLMDAYALGPDKSDDFLIQLLGDRHIVIDTPRWMHKSKKAPALHFEVSRENNSVEYTCSKIGEGVVALQVPYEEAYGMLNVSMTILSKPTRQKNFQVDFGSSWLQIAAWKRASRVISDTIRKDLSIMQTSLSTVYNHSMTELSTFVNQTKHRLAEQKKIRRAMLSSQLKHSHSKALLLAESKELSRYASQIRTERGRVARQIHSLKRHLAQRFSVYAHNRFQILSSHAYAYKQKLNEFKADRQVVAGEYLKAAQINALRAWWKVVGVPKTSRVEKPAGEEVPLPPKKNPSLFTCR